MSKGKLITVVGLDADKTKDVIDNIHGELGGEDEVIVMLDYMSMGVRMELSNFKLNNDISLYKTAWLFDLALSGQRIMEAMSEGKTVVTNISLRKTIAVTRPERKKHIKALLTLLEDIPTPNVEVYIDTSVNDSDVEKYRGEYDLLRKLCIGEYADMMGGETIDCAYDHSRKAYSNIATFVAFNAGVPKRRKEEDIKEPEDDTSAIKDDAPKVITKEELLDRLRELTTGHIALPVAMMMTGSKEKAIEALVNGPVTNCLYEDVVKMGLSDINRIGLTEDGVGITILPSE